MIKDWSIIHEMDMDNGAPTCYAKKFGDQQWWVTQLPSEWLAETKVKISENEPELIRVKNFRTPKSAINWVEKHHQEWTKSAWN